MIIFVTDQFAILIKTTFRSLRYRDFRVFWFGQFASLVGTWMQRTAQAWLVYTLTDSPFLVGLAAACQFAPLLLFSLFAGVIADRFPKRNILLLTQFLFAIQAAVITILTYTGLIQYWHILILGFLLGLTQALDTPTRQSFFVELVGKDDLTNAISLNSTVFNIARIIGPAVSGLVMMKFGIVFCFFINTVSFLPIILSIYSIKVKGEPAKRSKLNLIPEITEGIKYIKKNETLIVNALVMVVVCTFALNAEVMIPVFAKSVLLRGAKGYSMLLSMTGIGALLGAMLMAYLSKNGVRNVLLLACGIFTALFHVMIAFTHQYAASAIFIAATGFFNLLFLNTANSIFQLNTANEFRGRIMSVYTFLGFGSTPVGNFLVGAVMEKYGAAAGFLFCGVTILLLLGTILIIKRKEITTWFQHKLKTGYQHI